MNAIRATLCDRGEALRIAQMVGDSIDGSELAGRKKDALATAKEAEKALENIMSAVKMGIIHPSMQEEIDELTSRKNEALAMAAQIAESCAFDVEDFADFLQFGATLDDAAVLSAFVGQVVLCDGFALVTLNYKDIKNEPALLEVDWFAELQMAPRVGLEPTTLRLTAECSAN